MTDYRRVLVSSVGVNRLKGNPALMFDDFAFPTSTAQSKSDMVARLDEVRFTPMNRHRQIAQQGCVPQAAVRAPQRSLVRAF